MHQQQNSSQKTARKGNKQGHSYAWPFEKPYPKGVWKLAALGNTRSDFIMARCPFTVTTSPADYITSPQLFGSEDSVLVLGASNYPGVALAGCVCAGNVTAIQAFSVSANSTDHDRLPWNTQPSTLHSTNARGSTIDAILRITLNVPSTTSGYILLKNLTHEDESLTPVALRTVMLGDVYSVRRQPLRPGISHIDLRLPLHEQGEYPKAVEYGTAAAATSMSQFLFDIFGSVAIAFERYNVGVPGSLVTFDATVGMLVSFELPTSHGLYSDATLRVNAATAKAHVATRSGIVEGVNPKPPGPVTVRT